MKLRDTAFSFDISTVNQRPYSVYTTCCRYKILTFLFLGEFLKIFSADLIYFLK